jgi:hypothetical protein
MLRPSVNTDYQALSSFEAVRKTMLETRYESCLDKSLAFWVLSTDRRLPLAFMACPLRGLLATPFDELCATPGVGRKKIHSLVKLLLRASQNAPQEGAPPAASSSPTATVGDAADWSSIYDAMAVSESAWARWRETISRHGLNHEPLGRFAPSLAKLPSVIWMTPIGAYIDLSLAEMRALKTYGIKRVNAVIEIFSSLQRVLAAIEREPHLAVNFSCRTAYEIERWLEQTLAADSAPSNRELWGGFVEPMVRQLRIDAGDAVARLAESQLELRGEDNSIRNVAQGMGLTRARVYQLLDELSAIMQIRWPAGPSQITRLAFKLASLPTEASALRLFRATADLLFPGSLSPNDPDSVADSNGSSLGAPALARS